MNILQVLPEINVGGVETGTIDLARRLVELGHKAVVVSNGGSLLPELEACGVIHYKLPVHKKAIFAQLKVVPKLAEIIQKEKIDIVHARSRSPAWIAYWACRRSRAVFITTCHGYYKKHLFSYVMGWGKRVIALSNVIARHMIDDFGVPHERIKLIPRSVDLTKFKFVSPQEKRHDEFNVGIIGRFTPIKGHADFVKAMAKVARHFPKLKIWIVGDAPSSKESYKEQIQVLVRRLGLLSCTQFLGTQRDIPAILSQLDLLVMATTTQEAFGRVIIEAQAAGVPVVATKVGGVVDIIEDGTNGLLVPPADPTGMSEAIIRIFRDKELAGRLAKNAYLKVQEKYNIELMVDKTLAVYREALDNFELLIMKFSSAGDVILSTAAIRAIREKFGKKHRITFLVGEESKEILLGCPYIDELLVCDFKNKDKGFAGLWKLGSELRRRNFDLVIDLQNNRKSHLLAGLSLSLERYGYDNKKFSFLLNHSIKDTRPAIDPLAHQFQMLGLLGVELKDKSLELWPSEKDRRYIEDFLAGQWIGNKQRLIGINISASERWQTKNLPLATLVKLCEELSRREFLVVVSGTQKDLALAARLAAALKDTKIINACAKTSINQLACLIKKCSVYISADSAPLHISAACKTPFVALFAPTNPARHLPPAKDFVLLRKELPCSPCYKPHCQTLKCMRGISVEELLEAVDKLVK